MFQLTRPSAEQVNAFVAAQQGATFSYPEVGATASGPAPAGYNVDRNRVRLGTGAETFRRATAALLTWRMSSLGWMSIQPRTRRSHRVRRRPPSYATSGSGR